MELRRVLASCAHTQLEPSSRHEVQRDRQVRRERGWVEGHQADGSEQPNLTCRSRSSGELHVGIGCRSEMEQMLADGYPVETRLLGGARLVDHGGRFSENQLDCHESCG